MGYASEFIFLRSRTRQGVGIAAYLPPSHVVGKDGCPTFPSRIMVTLIVSRPAGSCHGNPEVNFGYS